MGTDCDFAYLCLAIAAANLVYIFLKLRKIGRICREMREIVDRGR